MASRFSLGRPSHLCNPKSFQSEKREIFSSTPTCSSKLNLKENKKDVFLSMGFQSGYFSLSQVAFSKWIPSAALSSMAAADSDHTITEEDYTSMVKANSREPEFNRVNCLVWILHESARSFSVAVQTLELARAGPELAMAWVGVDVHAWHKRIAYQVAVYAFLKAAVEVEVFLSHKRGKPSPVCVILSPKINILGRRIESELTDRDPRLVQWFKMVELPRIAGLFIPLFKKWSIEYAGSGVAGIILAISCCAAVRKLGLSRISSALYSISIEDALVELMTLSHSLVPIDKLHYLATEAGFEEDLLLHFGRKVLPNKNTEEEIEFWIGLVQKKLCTAFRRESITTDGHTFDKVQENSLATLGLFAHLGRETRLFLSKVGIKDLDEQTKDFLSYLECAILLVYPERSTVSEYQLFMEVITDEIGWLDFYGVYASKFSQVRRKCKQPVQAEREIILYNVFVVCYDVILGFAHYSNSTQQPLDPKLLEFLLQSQSMLTTCMDDYWAAYKNISGQLKNTEKNAADPSSLYKVNTNSSPMLEAQRMQIDMLRCQNHDHGSRLSQPTISAGLVPVTSSTSHSSAASKPVRENFIKRSTVNLVSASADIWMGTKLLFIDISDALRILMKQLRGTKITQRERKKLERTMGDITTLIPVTILMLLPVSAVGHAAMLAAIKKYMPSLIPSPYSAERLGLVKQLDRAKKRESQPRNSIEDTSCKVV